MGNPMATHQKWQVTPMKNGQPIASTSISNGNLRSKTWAFLRVVVFSYTNVARRSSRWVTPCLGCGGWDELQENGTWNGGLWCLLLEESAVGLSNILTSTWNLKHFFVHNVKVSKVSLQSLWTVSQNHQEAKHIKSRFCSFRPGKNNMKSSFPFFKAKVSWLLLKLGIPAGWPVKKVRNQKLQRDLFCRWKP